MACRVAMQQIKVPAKDHLESLYGGGMSVAQVAAHYGVAKGTASAWLKHHQIQTRTANTSLFNAAGRRRSRARAGRRSMLGGLYVRSSWEANYALILNHAIAQGLIDRWEYEPDCFEFPVKRGSRFYTPDFKVWRRDGRFEYHEVKGYLDQPSRTKLKRMQKYYPDLQVKLVDEKVYRAFEQVYGSVLEGWE